MEDKQLCFKCVFRTVFKPNGIDIYLIKDETRYFCAGKQCMLYSRKTIQNTFSDCNIPDKGNIVFHEQIYPNDRAIAFTAF